MSNIKRKFYFGEEYHKRIDTLFKEGIKLPLIVVQSAPGYGKSELVYNYLKNQSLPFFYLRLRELDNWGFIFWNHFTASLIKLYPFFGGQV